MARRIPRKLRAFYRTVRLTSPRAQKLWTVCKDSANVFQGHTLPEDLAITEAQTEEQGRVRLREPYADHSQYFPIEFFKTMGESLLPEEVPVRFFESSGTTAATKSKSPFSQDGLALYRATSVRTFYDLLTLVQGLPPLKMRPVSLVPSTAEWPLSSLAQMIAWIGQLWGGMTYVKADKLADFVRRHRRRPMFIFGTAIHWMSFLETGRRLRLPAGSVIIETGGLKATGMQVEREDLYAMLSTALKIPESAIISEYGMCEMASQAYDWQVLKFGTRRGPRKFRFPFWVNTAVMRGLGILEPAGQGALCVIDPMRLDFPEPLRTQDLVDLGEGGAFRYEGRVPHSVLKGCSLLAEDDIKASLPKTRASTPEQAAAGNTSVWVREPEIRNRAEKVSAFARNVLTADHALKLLTREIGSEAVARACLADLTKSLPVNTNDWVKAAKNALGTQNGQERPNEHYAVGAPQNWLFIPPGNHSIAALHPLLLGVIAGLHLTVRMPSEPTLELLSWVIHVLHVKMEFPIQTVPHSWRAGAHPLPPFVNAALVYGSDDTISKIQKQIPIPIRAFGTQLTVSIGLAPASSKDLRAIAKDFLSLGQRGCLSTRALVLGYQGDPQKFCVSVAHELTEASTEFWNEKLPWKSAVALDHEALSMGSLSKGWFRKDLNSPLIPYAISNGDLSGTDLLKAMSDRPFVLPIILVPLEHMASSVKRILAEVPALGTISVTSAAQEFIPAHLRAKVRVVAAGEANIMKWDGFYQDAPLFMTN